MSARSRRLPATLLAKEKPETPRSAGAGGAWKAGLQNDARRDRDRLENQRVADILEGRAAIELDPNQIEDRVGSDRRADWREREDYAILRDSIRDHGQDTPIEVWPIDPDWRPDPENPTDPGAARFELVTGRRRRAVAEELGAKVRAVLPPRGHDAKGHRWQVLLRRYRENNHRANLAPLERMISIAEMHEAWRADMEGGSIRKFASSIGIDPSFVSRCARAAKNLDALRAAHDDPWSLGYRDIEAWLAQRGRAKKPEPSARRTGNARSGAFDVAGRAVRWRQREHTLTLTIAEVAAPPDPEALRRWLETFPRGEGED